MGRPIRAEDALVRVADAEEGAKKPRECVGAELIRFFLRPGGDKRARARKLEGGGEGTARPAEPASDTDTSPSGDDESGERRRRVRRL